MAAECYSGSVERCQAVGVTPDSPSWWDYIVGKNHAKLVSVKRNIEAVCTNYLNANYATNGSFVDALGSHSADYISFSNSVHFATAIGLPSDFFTNTPYFKTQYPSVSNGWWGVKVCLTNLIVTRANVDWHPNVWTNTITSGALTGYPLLPTSYEMLNSDNQYALAGVIPEWEFTPYYTSLYDGHSLIYLLPETIVTNARGTFTTHSDSRTWAKDWNGARTYGLLESLLRPSFATNYPDSMQTNYGYYWQYPMLPYEAKHRPVVVWGGACDGLVTNTVITPVSTNTTIQTETNWTEVCVGTNMVPDTIEVPYWETNSVTNISYNVETNGWIPVTNVSYTYSTNLVSQPYTNYSVAYWKSLTNMFGTHFVGSSFSTSNAVYTFSATASNRNEVTVETNYTPMPDAPVLTNVFSGYYYTESITQLFQTVASGTSAVPIMEPTNILVTITNTVYEYATNKQTELRYAIGAVVINSTPYAGTISFESPWGLVGGESGDYLYNMIPIYDGFDHCVDLYYQISTSTNWPPTIPSGSSHPLPWHGYHEDAPSKWDSFSRTNRLIGGVGLANHWTRKAGETNAATIVFGNQVDLFTNAPDAQLSYGQFDYIQNMYLVDPPSSNSVYTYGAEVISDFAAIWWNGTNGFKYR